MTKFDSVETVLLDMDGTLLDLHFDTHFWLQHLPARVAQMRGMSSSEVDQKLLAHMRDRQGTLDWYSTDYWSSHLDVDVMALKTETQSRIGFRPGAEKLLQRLVSDGYQPIMVTNADRHVMELKFSQTGVNNWFTHLFSSHDFGFPKEDAGFWHTLHQHIDFDPATTLLIDDSLSVLRSARGSNIGHLLAPAQPDSQRDPVTDHEFVTIARFDDLVIQRN